MITVTPLVPHASNQERYSVECSEPGRSTATITLTYYCDQCRGITCEHMRAVRNYRAVVEAHQT